MWKYKIDKFTVDVPTSTGLVMKLNEYGADGWEAFSVSYDTNYSHTSTNLKIPMSTTITVIMKKPF